MDFEKIRVPYEGRREFGTEGGDGRSIANSIISQYFGGIGGAGGAETGGNGSGYGGDENRGGNAKSFNAWLSKNSRTFNELELAGAPAGITDDVVVMGYRDMEQAQTFIGNINFSAETSANTYDIQGLVQGIHVVVSGNGTTNTVLHITADSTLQSGGTLTIPVAVNINDNPLDPYQYVWWQNPTKVKLINLTYTWALDKGGSSNYSMDLSNEKAQINCDSAGTMFSASIMTVTCSASTYIGTEEIHPYYDTFTLPMYNATGFGINQDGVMYFNYSAGTIFNFQGNTLPIDIRAWEHQGDATPIAKKTMTIYRNYPGVDGADAVSHWIVTSVNQIKYNPNTNTFIPSAITATCWKQVGYREPEIDTQTQMWCWRSSYPTPSPYTAGTPIVVTAFTEDTSITFGLKNTNGEFYELEDVMIMRDGLSGATGPQGPTGASGKSAWYVSLDNSNCSINADSEGNIYPNAVHPTCVAKVYYGSQRMTTGFTWDIDAPDIGDNMIIENWDRPSAGCITFETTSALTFSGESIQISVGIKVSGETQDTKIWNITKSIAGADGETSKTYWLALNATEVSYNPNTSVISPSSISAVSYMQEGQNPPGVSSAETHIMMSKVIRSSGLEQGYSNYTMRSKINISVNSANTYSALRFKLYYGPASCGTTSSQLDQQDVLILMDGVDGTNGTNGRNGAAIRGPYDYYAVSSSTQCWCAGSATTQCSDCANWIDIVYKDNTYYRCIQSYQGSCRSGSTSGISNSNFWVSGETYDFVATRVLLAQNASIDFLTNNELYLRDSNNNITAGAAGGNGINFWAGWPSPSSAAPFHVNNDGTMVATKGTFGCFTIGEDDENDDALVGRIQEGSISDIDYTSYLNPKRIYFEREEDFSDVCATTRTVVSITPDQESYDPDGLVSVLFENTQSGKCGNIGPDYVDNIGFYTNGVVKANKLQANVQSPKISSGPSVGVAVMSLFPTEIVYMTADATLFTKEGHWYVGTMDTGISTAEPKDGFYKSGSDWFYNGRNLTYDGVCISGGTTSSIVSGAALGDRLEWHFNGTPLGLYVSTASTAAPGIFNYTGANKWKNGWWELPTGYIDDYQMSGIASTGMTKKNNTIYIEV